MVRAFPMAWRVAACVAAAAGFAAAAEPREDRFVAARERMVRDDIAAGGVVDPRVLEALRLTPRHEFVPAAQRHLAYFDMSLPIGEAQTISGPFVVAYMTEKLEPKPTDRVLEIGTGSGYQAAVLAPLVGMVYSIEIHEPLGQKAARTLARLGYRNVVTKVGDGFRGWPEHAPFDKIIVTCSPEDVPQPLVEQLAEGGRMVIPVGERFDQALVLLVKKDGRLLREALTPTLFVPMTGKAEDTRAVKPDGGRPEVHNGGFEEPLPDSRQPAAWYYGRQMEVVEEATVPEGKKFLRLTNDQPGRPAQVFQGFPVDGSRIGRLRIEVWLRGDQLRPGATADEVPRIAVRFQDAERSRSSLARIGPWEGTFAWEQAAGTVGVPAWAREAILHVGMMGATGRLDVDAVRLRGVPR
jgi:protein-L-isoaspartate(D-aspartate) O-methyltransferase